jgi:hypothetical protein
MTARTRAKRSTVAGGRARVKGAAMKMLTKADINTSDDRKKEVFEVPEWGGAVYISEITGLDRAAIVEKHGQLKEAGQTQQAFAMQDAMLTMALTDQNGDPLYTAEELPVLKKRNGNVLERIVKRAMEVNGFMPGAEEAAVKPSGEVQSGGSDSASA